jgi:hypothetical protein
MQSLPASYVALKFDDPLTRIKTNRFPFGETFGFDAAEWRDIRRDRNRAHSIMSIMTWW